MIQFNGCMTILQLTLSRCFRYLYKYCYKEPDYASSGNYRSVVLPNLIEDEQDIRHRMHQDPVVKHSDEADGDPEPSDVITYLDYHK
jgi:hypothetical protein